MNTYVALLRGINVGGHKKVPMAELKKMMTAMGFEDVKTLLNSGNVVFKAKSDASIKLEKKLESTLEQTFGFPVPVLVRKGEEIVALQQEDPFGAIEMDKDIRRYVTFLKAEHDDEPSLPWQTEDASFRILGRKGTVVFSILDLSKSRTVEGMKHLEGYYGKDITTRNWNTIQKITKLI